jgi:hypothetical protein
LERVLPFDRPDDSFSVLLMPPDVELEERGLVGSKARIDWAAIVREKTEATARAILEAKNVSVSVYLATDIQASESQGLALAQQRRLFQQLTERSLYGRRASYVIGATGPSLPSGFRDLKQASNARYGLFISLRDQYSSTERVVGQVALGALFIASIVFLGVPLTPLDLDDYTARQAPYGSMSPPSGMAATSSGSRCPEQIGYASLVDLDTGNVVWLNRVSEGCSDLRDPDDLQDTLELLLSGLP